MKGLGWCIGNVLDGGSVLLKGLWHLDNPGDMHRSRSNNGKGVGGQQYLFLCYVRRNMNLFLCYVRRNRNCFNFVFDVTGNSHCFKYLSAALFLKI